MGVYKNPFIFLPETGVDGAAKMAERARLSLQRMPIPLEDGRGLAVTASFGVAGFNTTPREGATSEFLIGQADERLYQAKREGRNRVAQSPPLEKRSA